MTEYSLPRTGKVLIGHRSIVVVLNSVIDQSKWQFRIDFEWDCIDMIYTQQGRLPSLMITTKYAPRMYRNTEHDLPNMMTSPRNNKFARKKSRIPCLDALHSSIIGSCFTWEFIFEPRQSLRPVQNLVEHIPDGPTSMRISVATICALTPFADALRALNLHMAKKQLPFIINFQAMRLALGGHLPPELVGGLLDYMSKLLRMGKSALHCAEVLRKLDRDLPWHGPQTPAEDLGPKTVMTVLQELMDGDMMDNSAFRAVERSDTLAMVHRMRVTPTGLYLEGPDPEVRGKT